MSMVGRKELDMFLCLLQATDGSLQGAVQLGHKGPDERMAQHLP